MNESKRYGHTGRFELLRQRCPTDFIAKNGDVLRDLEEDFDEMVESRDHWKHLAPEGMTGPSELQYRMEQLEAAAREVIEAAARDVIEAWESLGPAEPDPHDLGAAITRLAAVVAAGKP